MLPGAATMVSAGLPKLLSMAAGPQSFSLFLILTCASVPTRRKHLLASCSRACCDCPVRRMQIQLTNPWTSCHFASLQHSKVPWESPPPLSSLVSALQSLQ